MASEREQVLDSTSLKTSSFSDTDHPSLNNVTANSQTGEQITNSTRCLWLVPRRCYQLPTMQWWLEDALVGELTTEVSSERSRGAVWPWMSRSQGSLFLFCSTDQKLVFLTPTGPKMSFLKLQELNWSSLRTDKCIWAQITAFTLTLAEIITRFCPGFKQELFQNPPPCYMCVSR